MIPTHRPTPRLLEETLRSVLEQDPGPLEMQIEIVDDASPGDHVEKLVREVGRGRIALFRQTRTLAMAGNWNTAVVRARGRWVHLLHQDDLVLQGFYSRLRSALEANGSAGAAVVQHHLIDANGTRLRLVSPVRAAEARFLGEWRQHVFIGLSFQTPAIVVRRDVYEHLGGFRPEFRYALDWDMWKRVAASYPIWYEPKPLACWRRHQGGASTHFRVSGENMAEIRRSIDLAREYLPAGEGETVARAAREYYAGQAVEEALYSLVTLRDPRTALEQMRQGRRFAVAGFWILAARRLVSEARRRFREAVAKRRHG